MPTLKHTYALRAIDRSKYPIDDGRKYVFRTLSKKAFDGFTPTSLGLGDLATEGRYVQSIAAIFDLEGFTAFCNQVDSHLVIPEFLTRYLDWLFARVREELKESEEDDRVALWCDLPFFVKFMGDGLLFLWDTGPMPLGGPR